MSGNSVHIEFAEGFVDAVINDAEKAGKPLSENDQKFLRAIEDANRRGVTDFSFDTPEMAAQVQQKVAKIMVDNVQNFSASSHQQYDDFVLKSLEENGKLVEGASDAMAGIRAEYDKFHQEAVNDYDKARSAMKSDYDSFRENMNKNYNSFRENTRKDFEEFSTKQTNEVTDVDQGYTPQVAQSAPLTGEEAFNDPIERAQYHAAVTGEENAHPEPTLRKDGFGYTIESKTEEGMTMGITYRTSKEAQEHLANWYKDNREVNEDVAKEWASRRMKEVETGNNTQVIAVNRAKMSR